MSTSDFILEEVKKHYESCLETHKGDLVKEVDWNTPEASETRYNVFRNFYNSFPSGWDAVCGNITTLLDFGCGTGTFGSDYPFAPYIGCDISEEMIKEAKKRNPNREFFVFDGKTLPDSYDVIIANGTFTEKLEWSNQEFYEYLVYQLTLLLSHTKKGLAFNVMDWHKIAPGKHKENLFFMTYNEIAFLMETLKVTRYIIDASYGLYDSTIKIYK